MSHPQLFTIFIQEWKLWRAKTLEASNSGPLSCINKKKKMKSTKAVCHMPDAIKNPSKSKLEI